MTKNNELYPYSYENQNAIKAFEETYPILAEEFKKIQRDQYETFCKKQFDYGPHNISLGSELRKQEDINASISAIVI